MKTWSWFPLFQTDKCPWLPVFCAIFIFQYFFTGLNLNLKYCIIFGGFSLWLADKFSRLFQHFYQFSSMLGKIPGLFQSKQNSLTKKCSPFFPDFPVWVGTMLGSLKFLINECKIPLSQSLFLSLFLFSFAAVTVTLKNFFFSAEEVFHLFWMNKLVFPNVDEFDLFLP